MPNLRIFKWLVSLSLIAFCIVPQLGAADGISLEVLNPIASTEVERVVPVPRLSTLNNKRVLLYWNRKLHADVAVDEVKKQLENRFSGIELTIVKGSPWAPEKGFYEEVMAWKPQAIISSTGD